MSTHFHADLKKIALFADLPDEMLAQLASEVQEAELSAGEVLFKEGDEGDCLYFIRRGEVEIYQASDGKIFELLDEGDSFGEMALFEAKPRSASARARTEVALLRLDQKPFMALLEKNPQMALKVTSTVSARLRTVMGASQPDAKATLDAAKTGSDTKVFISYSRRDKPFVLQLNEALSKYGIDTWVDWENIPLTADWWNEIRQGIEDADAFAFVISPDSLTSEVCGREIQTAVDTHKRLIPILHREPEKGNPMHEKVSAHNWIYMRDDAELTANVPQMLATINTDLDFVRSHTRLLERALSWERAKKNNSFVLQGDELQSAERWLEGAGGKEPQPTSLHIEFIQASRRAANQRQRAILTASLVGLGIAVVLAIISFVFFLQARDAQADAEIQRDNALAAEAYANQQASIAATAQAEAEISRDNALVAQATALAAQAEAERQASIAATEQAKAETAQAEAEAQKVIAEDQAKLAKAGDLAASGQTLLESNPPLAVLLALESNRLSPNNPTAQNVLSLLPVYFPPLVDTFIDSSAQYIAEISWSPAGQLVSTSGPDLVFWNLDAHEPETILYGHTANITALAWSADGRLATGDENGTILLWDLTTGEPETLYGVQGSITSLSWSPLGRLASSSWDGSIVIRDLSTQNTETKTLQYPVGVNAVAWSPFGALASGGDDGKVVIWNVQRETQDVAYPDHKAGILSLAWSRDGYLASGSKDSTVAVRNPSGNLAAVLRGHTDYVNAVAWSEEGLLASASWDKTVILWDLVKKEPERIFQGHSTPVATLAWGEDGILASAGEFIFFWNTHAAKALTTYPGHLDWVNSVAWTPDGQLVSAGYDNQLIFWDEATGEAATTLAPFFWGTLHLSANNRLLSDGTLLDRATGQEYYFNGSGHDLSPDGNFVAGIPFGEGNEIAIWSLAPLLERGVVMSQTVPVEGVVQTLAWSPEGNLLATGQGDGSILLWDFNDAVGSVSPRAPLPASGGGITLLAWSPDGRLASAGNDGDIHIWEVNTQTETHVLAGGHFNPVTAISWSPYGELASISGDQWMVIWEVDQERIKAVLGAPYRAAISSVAWSPDGTQLAFGGNSYNVYVYDAFFVQPPCLWLTRNMTFAEWNFYLPGEPYQPTCLDLPVGTAYLDAGVQLAVQGDITNSIAGFQQAEAQGLAISSWQWNDLCWFGAVYNQAEMSHFACERALELAPEDGDIRDSRGVSRALLGDFAGAIEDFEAFIAYAQKMGHSTEEDIALRQEWIEALQAGNNPFDEETLAMLRGE